MGRKDKLWISKWLHVCGKIFEKEWKLLGWDAHYIHFHYLRQRLLTYCTITHVKNELEKLRTLILDGKIIIKRICVVSQILMKEATWIYLPHGVNIAIKVESGQLFRKDLSIIANLPKRNQCTPLILGPFYSNHFSSQFYNGVFVLQMRDFAVCFEGVTDTGETIYVYIWEPSMGADNDDQGQMFLDNALCVSSAQSLCMVAFNHAIPLNYYQRPWVSIPG